MENSSRRTAGRAGRPCRVDSAQPQAPRVSAGPGWTEQLECSCAGGAQGFRSLGTSLLLHLSSFLFPLPPISEETRVLGGRVRNSSTAQAAQVSVSPSTQWAGGSEGTSSSEALQGLNMSAPLGTSWLQDCSGRLFQGAGQRDGRGIPAAWGLGRDVGPVLPRLGGALGTRGQEVSASLRHVWD